MALLMRIALLPLLLAMTAGQSFASDVTLAEQKIKAGMIYNFLKYTDWPVSDASLPMVTCLFGGDPFDGHLAPMQGRSVNLRTVEVRRMDNIDDAAKCHLIVVDDDSQWPRLREALQGKRIMTVSDNADFLTQGGMIRFGHEGNRITVTLNIDATRAAKLTVQQRLLNLVTTMRSEQ